jgi:uncharacterized protein (TIGR02147 family)
MVTKIFEHKSYRSFLKARLRSMPGKGRGEIKRIAAFARIDPSYVSQILKGTKSLREEHAVLVGKYLGLDEPETEFLMELVRFENAAGPELRRFAERRLAELRKRAGEPEARAGEPELRRRDEALLFSNWQYDAVRLATSVDGLQTLDAISRRFALPKELVRQILDFLVRADLCAEKNGRFEIARRHLKLEPDSRMMDRHLLNWRSLAQERVVRSTSEDFFYSVPVALEAELASKIRARLREWLDELLPQLERSRSEVLRCLNIDWFEF